MRDETDLEDLRTESEAKSSHRRYQDMPYAKGVRDAIRWVLESGERPEIVGVDEARIQCESCGRNETRYADFDLIGDQFRTCSECGYRFVDITHIGGEE